jgi:phage terminase large subunit
MMPKTLQPKEIEFRTKNPKQLEAAEYWVDDETEELVYGGAKYGGKSYLGASMIFGDALIYPDTHYFIAREELNDLRKFTIPTINEVFKNWGLNINDYATYNGQDNFYRLTNGSLVYLIHCKEIPTDLLYERFGSMQMTRGWIEEGGQIKEAAKRNLALSIGRWKNDVYKLKKKLLIICNPKKGWLKREYVEPWKTGTLAASKKFIQAFATDNKHGNADYIKGLSEEKDLVTRQRLWEGNWDYDDDLGALMKYDNIRDLFTNNIVKDGQNYLIVDVARYGRDKTVFNFFEGLESVKRESFSEQGTDKTIQLIRDRAAEFKIPYSHILIDEDGVGGGVVDQLTGVKGFMGGSSPVPTRTAVRRQMLPTPNLTIDGKRQLSSFQNLKTQCAFKLAELVETHRMAIKPGGDQDEITEEFSQIKQRDMDKDGKLKIVGKDEVREAIGRSPDTGDTFIMRMYFELLKDATGGTYEQSVSAISRRQVARTIQQRGV